MTNLQLLLQLSSWYVIWSNFGVRSEYEHKTILVTREKSGIYGHSAYIAAETSGFIDLIARSRMFIDKSLFIESFLHYPSQVILMTCPKAWGKSINIDMMKLFLQMSVDRKGNEVHGEGSLNAAYRLFQYGEIRISGGYSEKLQKPLLIARNQRLMNEHLGKYPVVFVCLKHALGSTFLDIESGFRAVVSRAYQEHEYLAKVFQNIIDDSKVSTNEKIKTKALLFKFENILYEAEWNVTVMENSLHFLCELLNNHFRKPVYVLIDDYDYLIWSILTNDMFNEEDEKKLFKFLDSLFCRTFKNNQYLKRGFITGKFDFVKQCFNESADIIDRHSYFDSPFTEYYGFNRKDVDLLFNSCSVIPNLADAAHDWFNGYKLHVNRDLRFYSPWPVVKFINNKSIKQYWNESESGSFIDKLIQNSYGVRRRMILLLGGMKVLCNPHDYDLNTSSLALLHKRDLHTLYWNKTTRYLSLFRSYLLAGGLATISLQQSIPQNSESINGTLVEIANKESLAIMAKPLLSFYAWAHDIDEKFILQASEEMNTFILNNEVKSSSLQTSLKAYYEQLYVYPTIIQMIEGKESSDERYIDAPHMLLDVILLQMQYTHSKFHTKVKYTSKLDTAYVMRNDKAKRGIILKITYMERELDEAMLNLETQYGKVFEEFDHIEMVKFIIININNVKHVKIIADVEKIPSRT